MSDFAGLRLALSALTAQRRAVELSAHNAANSNTEGYSRQRVDMENIGSPAVPALFSTWTGDGAGVRVANITRYRDQFLEIRAAVEYGAGALLAQGSTTMRRIQDLYREPTDDGLARMLSDFWAAWDDVANHPENTASRTQLLERAGTFLTNLAATSNQLTVLQRDTTSELSANVADINAMSASIAELNAAIKANTIADLPVNDLMDKRDLLVTKLAAASGGTVRSVEYNQVNVILNGTALVSQNKSTDLVTDTSGSPVVVRWSTDNSVASVTSGKLGGQLEAINATIPGYIARLDTLATTLRDQVNELHGSITGSLAVADQDQSGAGNLIFEISLNGAAYQTVTVPGADWSGAGGAAALQTALQAAVDAAIGAGEATVTVGGGNGSVMDVAIDPTGTSALTVQANGANVGFATLLGTTGVGTDGVGGRAFFEGTTAANLALAADVNGNPAAIAAGVAGGGPLDSSRALALAELSEATDGADAYYQLMIVQLGVDTQTAVDRDDIQAKSLRSLDNARAQVSGVSLDEEMTNLVQYQHAYDAAARFLVAIDEMLDTLINHTAA